LESKKAKILNLNKNASHLLFCIKNSPDLMGKLIDEIWFLGLEE
jgi:hypothetical protein